MVDVPISTSTTLATRDELFSASEQLALAGFLAGYSGLTRDAYTLDLRQYVAWCTEHHLAVFGARRADIECFARHLESRGRPRATIARRLCTVACFSVSHQRYGDTELPISRPVVLYAHSGGQRAPAAGNLARVSGAIDRYPEGLRDDLPRGESYPMRRSEVDAALLSHGAERLDLIYFLRGGQRWVQDSGEVIGVRFRARGEYSESLELRVFSVPTRLRVAVRAVLMADAFARVAAWIAAADRSEEPWRSTDHALRLRWERAALHREEFTGDRARSVY